MTWLQRLTARPVVSSVFLQLEGDGAKNDLMHEFLDKYVPDTGSIDDLFHRQQPITREMLVAVLEARIRRRLC